MANWGRWLVLASASVGVSCVTPAGSFTPDRFAHNEYPYEVRYVEEGPKNLLGADWRLDNYVWTRGAPSGEKRGSEYFVTREYDLDDDGNADVRLDEPYYDLLLEHRRKDAVIWLRSVPISNDDANKDLAVFADNYVDTASGSNSVLVRFGLDGPVGPRGKRFASRVLSRAGCSIASAPAYRVDFEVANVDRLELTPSARWSRNRVVLLRTPFRHVPSPDDHKDISVPVVMLAGLRAAPEDFEALSADFDRLLDRIVIADSDYALSEAQPVAQSCRVDPGEFAQASSGAPKTLKARKGRKARTEQPSQAQASSIAASETPGAAAAFAGTPPSSPAKPTTTPPVSAPAPVGAAPAETDPEESHGF
jgi:hypothetical protein